ncbi:uncharacterized protein J3R85_016245 [Psidium guajava]|nr:uncharacterized protein J3R85_016245 [Psidium guajava]
MAQPAGTMQFAPQPVVGLQYCCPYPVDVAILKKVMHISDGNFMVTDNNGNHIFKVKGALLTLHDFKVLIDASGNPFSPLGIRFALDWLSMQVLGSFKLGNNHNHQF